MSDDFSSNVHTLGSVTVGGAATGELEHLGGQNLEAMAGRRCTIDLRGSRADRGTPGDRHRRGIHVADSTLMPGTKNDDGGEDFNRRATFTSTAKVMRKSGSQFPITGMLFAVLISAASPPAVGSTGCAGYAKPLNRAESFWRQAEEQQVRACIRRFGVAPSDNEENLMPLHLAAWFSGNPAVITALLQGGAEPNAKLDAKSAQGATPLHIAAKFNSNPAIFQALLNGGAEPNAKSAQGSTPLHIAAQENSNPAVVEALLNGGAEINAKNVQGATPLHVAANFNSDPAILKALLEGGADPKAETLGKTAFDLARNNPKLRGSDAFRQLREAQEAPKSVPDTLDLTKEDYLAIQRLLNEKGFRAGPEDGRWGSKSRGALLAFQAQGGLRQTGVPNKATRKALGFQETAESETRDVVGAKDGVALRDVCGAGQELEPGQGCRIPGGGEFKVESDGCVKEIPDVPGPTSTSKGLISGGFNFKTGENTMSTCIRGHVGKGKFSARYDAEKSVWRIESLPEAN